MQHSLLYQEKEIKRNNLKTPTHILTVPYKRNKCTCVTSCLVGLAAIEGDVQDSKALSYMPKT